MSPKPAATKKRPAAAAAVAMVKKGLPASRASAKKRPVAATATVRKRPAAATTATGATQRPAAAAMKRPAAAAMKRPAAAVMQRPAAAVMRRPAAAETAQQPLAVRVIDAGIPPAPGQGVLGGMNAQQISAALGSVYSAPNQRFFANFSCLQPTGGGFPRWVPWGTHPNQGAPSTLELLGSECEPCGPHIWIASRQSAGDKQQVHE